MFDAFSYPVSALMKLWHDLLSLLIAPDSGVAWVGSLVLLVCSVRLILLRPAWKQLWSRRRTALLRPRMAELKRQHGPDRQAYLDAVRELQRSEGVGAASGCLPLLIQLPVFIGLYHLLAAFALPGGDGGNGIFGQEQVHSFAHATVFGVPLSAAIRTPAATLAALQPGLSWTGVLWVVLPFLLVASAATFVNAWRTQRRPPPTVTDVDNPMTDGMRQATAMMVWLAPLGLLFGGVIFPLPLALAIYWALNGTWTTIQTQLITARLDRLLPLPR